MKASQGEEVRHFFFSLPRNHQPTKITACLRCTNHLSLKGLNSSSTLVGTPQTSAAEGRTYTHLRCKILAFSNLLSKISFLFFFCRYHTSSWNRGTYRLHMEALILSDCCLLCTTRWHLLVIGSSQTQTAELDTYLTMSVGCWQLDWQPSAASVAHSRRN